MIGSECSSCSQEIMVGKCRGQLRPKSKPSEGSKTLKDPWESTM